MKPSLIFKKINGDGLIKNEGHMLDLGFGPGNEVINFANIGFGVDAVDSNIQTIDSLKNELENNKFGELKINLINEKIENFRIQKEKYDCIIASNSLPFILEKEKVIEVIRNIVDGLKLGGCMYITIFGTKDAWVTKESMTFFDYAEIKKIIDSLGVDFYHSTIEEGYGKTMKGDLKYWNIFRFIYIKK